MSSMTRKIKRNKPIIDIQLSMKFECPNCKKAKIISKKQMDSIKREKFNDNKIFVCDKCDEKMYPTEVIADY